MIKSTKVARPVVWAGLISSRSSPHELWSFPLLPLIGCVTSHETVSLLFALLNALVFQLNTSGVKPFPIVHKFPLRAESLCFSESLNTFQHIREHFTVHSSRNSLFNPLTCKTKGPHFYGVRHLHRTAAQPLQGQSISLRELIVRAVCELDCHSASIVTMFDLCPHILLVNDHVVY